MSPHSACADREVVPVPNRVNTNLHSRKLAEEKTPVITAPSSNENDRDSNNLLKIKTSLKPGGRAEIMTGKCHGQQGLTNGSPEVRRGRWRSSCPVPQPARVSSRPEGAQRSCASAVHAGT